MILNMFFRKKRKPTFESYLEGKDNFNFSFKKKVVLGLKEFFEDKTANTVKLYGEDDFPATMTVYGENSDSKYWIQIFDQEDQPISVFDLHGYYDFLDEALERGYYPIAVFTVGLDKGAEKQCKDNGYPMHFLRDSDSLEGFYHNVNKIIESMKKGPGFDEEFGKLKAHLLERFSVFLD